MERRTQIAVAVAIVAIVVVASFGAYMLFFKPHASLPNNYEINTSLSLSSNQTRNVVEFNLSYGGNLWINYTSSGPLTVYVLNSTQMSDFTPGSQVSSFYSPGANLSNYNQTSPVNLPTGYYSVIFYNPGNSQVNVDSANISWAPSAKLIL